MKTIIISAAILLIASCRTEAPKKELTSKQVDSINSACINQYKADSITYTPIDTIKKISQ